MRFYKTAGRPALLAVLLAVLVCALSFPAGAKTQAAPPAPDANSNPVLADLAKMGAKFYYLGNRSGLDGWLVVKDGQMQIAYIMNGKQDIIIGALFGPDGANVTAQQIDAAMSQNKEIVNLLGANATTQVSQTIASQGAAGISPGEQLVKALSGASGVTLGSAKAPEVFMVMDPDCPHCRATWRVLRDSVAQNKLQLRMIPIGLDDDSERAAAVFLHVSDPLASWNKYVDGDKAPFAGTPDASLVNAVRANHELIDSWAIDATPWLVYRSKSGEIKIIKGEVHEAAPLLADLPQ